MFKKLIKKIRSNRGFTLLEMAIVLFIIGVLLLIIIPNVSDQRSAAESQGNEALVKVVESQSLLYEIEMDTSATYEGLLSSGYLTEEQVQNAQDANIPLP